ncbi:hypothetical protein CBS147323_8335 [Aspergillus niger]|nr:hypothetical protein CBS147323_8335 [Aspergillus niger]
MTVPSLACSVLHYPAPELVTLGNRARTQLLLTIDCYPPTSVNEPLKRYRALRIPTYAVSRTTSSADIPLGFSVLDPTQKL